MEANRKKQLGKIYLGHFQEIYKRSEPQVMHHICSCAEKNKEQIAQTYFDIICSTNEGKKLFTQEEISTELVPGLESWICDLFIIRHEEEDILTYINNHFEVGEKFVRINMPSHLLNLGSRVLKMDICNRLINKDCDTKDAKAIYTQVAMIVDTSMSITMEAFMDDKLIIERRSQALQNHILGSELAEACQNIRAEMHNWHTTLLNIMLKPGEITVDDLPAVGNSQFALWLRHKANVFFKDADEIEILNLEIKAIEQKFCDLLKFKNDNNSQELLTTIESINAHVKKMSWLLESLAERAHALDSGRDPLTRLYNRRYLDVIMQKETALAINNDTPHVVMMIDIDDFKHINDSYGHQDGDKVIENVARALYESVRSSDYVFRYGGDEFLILLINTEQNQAKNAAKEILKKINIYELNLGDGRNVDISISIGIAKFRGSSDYMSLIKQADKALLKAKQSGKNKFSVI